MNQIDWELSHYEKLKAEHMHKMRELRREGRGRTLHTKQILIQKINDVSDQLRDNVTLGKQNTRKKVVRKAALRGEEECYDALAYIGMTNVISRVLGEEPNRKKLAFLSEKIGHLIELDQRKHVITSLKGALYQIRAGNQAIKWRTSKTKDDSLLKPFLDDWEEIVGEEYVAWTGKERVLVGTAIIQAILEVMPEYFILNSVKVPGNYKKAHIIDSTKELRDFIQDYDEFLFNANSISVPCIEQPHDWVVVKNQVVGGFHTPELAISTPFYKVNSSQQKAFFREHIPTKHLEACNYMQSVQWEINEDCLEFLKQALETGAYDDVPCIHKVDLGPRPDDTSIEARKAWDRDTLIAYTQNEKKAKRILRIQRVIGLATQLIGKPIWFVYTADFRGRVYCSSSALSTQGNDFTRSLLRFREGKRLGKAGIQWLAVHGANLYGNKKITYTDRYRWVMDNMESIQLVASNPYTPESIAFLVGADKPFQFFAFCREWASAHNGENPEDFISHLPVGLDGSCNGLQHISALLCDEEGGARVNLLKSPLPEDLYKLVHTRLTKIIAEDTDNPVAIALNGNIDKKVVKQVILTIPYSSTHRGISNTFIEYIMDNLDVFPECKDVKVLWEYANYCCKHIRECSDDLLFRAKELMAWLRTVVRMISKEQKQLQWISPVEFPVCHNYIYYEKQTIATTTRDNKPIYLNLMNPKKDIHTLKACNAITANLIHSLDSSHMVMTALNAKDIGITSSYVHDEYNTHAADCPVFYEIIRDQFCKLYIPDNLESFRRQLERNSGIGLPPPPDMGTYDICEIYDATYFFS